MAEDTATSSLALERIRLQIEALDIAIDNLVKLRDAHGLDNDYANARIDRLDSRQSDLYDERRTILLTGAVASPPSAAQVEELRARVLALRNRNVSRASIEGLITETLAIAGGAGVLPSPRGRSVTASAFAAASPNSGGRSVPSASVGPLAIGFAAGVVSALAAQGLLDRGRA